MKKTKIIVGVIILGLLVITYFVIRPVLVQKSKMAESELRSIEAQRQLDKTKQDAILQLCSDNAEANIEKDLKSQGKSLNTISAQDKQTLIDAYVSGCYSRNTEQ